MDYTFNVNWQGNVVGAITNLFQDMWYLSGDWERFETAETEKFEQLVINFNREAFAKDPVAYSVKVILFNINHPERKLYCLATSLNENKISLRHIIAKDALDKFFPGR
ncbi:hypothetical protein [[Flexibacter] sp. ATCC 35208]|uniref:hypothetical protein n=1 Tax=[Flexibacter] sp. ATCC 35208 TaxID=1936242 RepID=UPI0009C67083|nr:hypothetical protein [[Flexibacter] sp. ATCC 35208]OMP76195.1 hypothetical protein BW716_26315 [[Flexibacter] sp. ATCC 35208]